MLDMTHPGILLASSSYNNEHNNLSVSIGGDHAPWWDANDDKFSIGREEVEYSSVQDFEERDTAGPMLEPIAARARIGQLSANENERQAFRGRKK